MKQLTGFHLYRRSQMAHVAFAAVAVIALTLGIYGAWEKTGTTPSQASALTLAKFSSASRIAEVHQSVRTDVSQRLSLQSGIERETEQITQGEYRMPSSAGKKKKQT